MGHHQRNDHCWDDWSQSGYDCYTNPASAASTPHGSPHHSIGQHNNGFSLPMEAMHGMPPPFPGTDGSNTPYGSSATPMGSGYGSYQGSPCMSPVGSPHHNGQMQYQVGAPCPSIPAWPFAPGAAQGQGGCNLSTQPGMEGGQFFSVPMGQPAQGPMPGMNQMMQQQPDNQMQMPNGGFSGPGGFGGSPTSYALGTSPSAWQGGQLAGQQQSPFPMPLSPPHDLAQSCAQPSQAQQAFFETMPSMPQGNGQAANGSGAGVGGQNPFCL